MTDYERKAKLKKKQRTEQLEEIFKWITLFSFGIIMFIMMLIQWCQPWGVN